ncbi:hypothetical protein HID58_013605, partial [Brassica napus]
IRLSIAMADIYFKSEHPLERRQIEASRTRDKYPDRMKCMLQVIVEKAERSLMFPISTRKIQYLVPDDLTVGQFVNNECLYMYLCSCNDENKDEDGFLYMTYSGENTFGLV